MTTLEKTEMLEETAPDLLVDAEFAAPTSAPRQLSACDSKILLSALENPPKPGAALLQAAKRYRVAKHA